MMHVTLHRRYQQHLHNISTGCYSCVHQPLFLLFFPFWQNGSYVLPMLWWGSPLKLSCPVQMSIPAPSVFCSPYGMAVQMHSQEQDVAMLGVIGTFTHFNGVFYFVCSTISISVTQGLQHESFNSFVQNFIFRNPYLSEEIMSSVIVLLGFFFFL